MKYSFEILEKAIGKERPRVNTKTGAVYTPNKTSSFEEKVKWAFKAKYNVQTELSTKPFKAIIKAIYEPPKSMSKKKREELIQKQMGYTKKSDIDNIVKIILDSLNGVAYKDDAQVIELEAKKRYGEKNVIYIELEEVEN